MAKRKRPVHRTALPLLHCITAGKFTRAQVAEKLGLDVQNVTNWLARGIPAKELSSVASLCELSTDDYRIQAGLATRGPQRLPAGEDATEVAPFEMLPEFLQIYITRKIAALLHRYESVPIWLRDKLAPPSDPDQYSQWETQIEAVMQRLAQVEEKVAG